MLYIFAGLPGTGKSSLSSRLAGQRGAVYLRIDTIEQSMRQVGIDDMGPKGYGVAYGVALDNLCLGVAVVADSVNPLDITRRAWRETAGLADSPFVEIEIVCSDAKEHQARIESRTTDIAGLKLPTWQDVLCRTYEPWQPAPIVIDTADRSIEQSMAEMIEALRLKGY
ncbi:MULTISPECIES: AAA family ATPase [Cyanophyceae]|uniref:AAA family ATPase n=1 Tax=Cyanophyceae TaxID=3028117 RepID=UPI001686BA6D|nr:MULTISPECIES: AAA family ATPase [Cyanophyceae]MBD1919365.1 AAA family ATPase [Phormidium sp. FACHB-77]MBD2054375.1 AAA family ATPase [Leptolyngbya sp. FACHB-60]